MKKRQIISLLIGCAVTAALAGCSTGERTQTTETLTAAESETVLESEVTESAELEGDPSVSDESETAEIDSADEAAAKSLVVYFSWSGNTRSVAEEIQAQTDADLFEIVPAEPYTDDYNALLDLAQEEQASEARPEIAGSVENLEDYEVIYLGYPNWWGDMPMILYTFFDSHDLSGKTVVISGAGNVAIYAAEKAYQLGAKPVTMSDSTGWIYDPEGLDLSAIKEIKEIRRARLSEYTSYRPNAQYHEGKGVWSVKCDVALPCATQNELLLEDAKTLVANGVLAVAEGANMPTTIEATEYLQEHGVLFAPGKASNAGGVATSALEMSQNSMRLSWTFEEVDAKLKDIMNNIFQQAAQAAEKYGFGKNYVAGANIAGFVKVAEAMMAEGVF